MFAVLMPLVPGSTSVRQNAASGASTASAVSTSRNVTSCSCRQPQRQVALWRRAVDRVERYDHVGALADVLGPPLFLFGPLRPRPQLQPDVRISLDDVGDRGCVRIGDTPDDDQARTTQPDFERNRPVDHAAVLEHRITVDRREAVLVSRRRDDALRATDLAANVGVHLFVQQLSPAGQAVRTRNPESMPSRLAARVRRAGRGVRCGRDRASARSRSCRPRRPTRPRRFRHRSRRIQNVVPSMSTASSPVGLRSSPKKRCTTANGPTGPSTGSATTWIGIGFVLGLANNVSPSVKVSLAETGSHVDGSVTGRVMLATAGLPSADVDERR